MTSSDDACCRIIIDIDLSKEPIRNVLEVDFQALADAVRKENGMRIITDKSDPHVSYVQVGRWLWCYHCRVIVRTGQIEAHYCGAPWQTRPDDIPADWIPLRHPGNELDHRGNIIRQPSNLPEKE